METVALHFVTHSFVYGFTLATDTLEFSLWFSLARCE